MLKSDMSKTDRLFKNGKPVIRDFKFIEGDDAGDVPYIWDAYKKGLVDELPENLEMEDFIEFVELLLERSQEAQIVEDKVNGDMQPVAAVFCRSDGWQLEPHVQYFDNATPKSILRTYAAYLKKTKYRKDIGACLVRVGRDTVNLANRVEKLGLLQYVGKVWGGKPDGDEYLYSVRCKRRH